MCPTIAEHDLSAIASKDLFANEVFAGAGEAGGAPPIVVTESGGAELIFLHPKTNEVILSASRTICVIFEVEITCDPYGGINNLDFRFSYAGSIPAIAGAKIRIRLRHQDIGYATLASFSLDKNFIVGTGTSIWSDIASYKPPATQVFYRQNIKVTEAIKQYAIWLNQWLEIEGYQWPVEEVIIADDMPDYVLASIDSQNQSIKAMFDFLAKLLGASYEIRERSMVFRLPKKEIITAVYDVDIAPDLNTVVNVLDIYALDRASEDQRLQQTIREEESIRRYGIKRDKLEFPFHLNVDYEQFKGNVLTPEPRYVGKYKMIVDNQIWFDAYHVPYYQRDRILSLGNSLDHWSGAVALVNHDINGQAIRLTGRATYHYSGAMDTIRIEARGNFTVRFYGFDRSVVGTFSTQGDAYKDFAIGIFVMYIEIEGTANILAITGMSSQTTFAETLPTAITYHIGAGDIVAEIEISAGDTLVDILSNTKNNQNLMRNALTRA